MTAEKRYANRQKHSKPILDEFFARLSEIHFAGGTKLAKAVQYCPNEKAYLYRFSENGNILVDNNRAENAIRPFVVGRKNWIFSPSPKGMMVSAIFYAVAATAYANDLNIESILPTCCVGEVQNGLCQDYSIYPFVTELTQGSGAFILRVLYENFFRGIILGLLLQSCYIQNPSC